MSTPEAIARLNDACRAGLVNLYVTRGLLAHAGVALPEVLAMVQHFDAFTPDNDPWGERDFGAFEFRGARVFWKIDTYNREMTAGSEDPADEAVTVRVLTVMLAGEW